MTTIENLKEIINTVLLNRGKSILEKISENAKLRENLGMDSLDLAELTVRIEAEYDVDIFEDGIVNTIDEILQKINKN